MNNDDERDYAEEAANAQLLREDQDVDLDAIRAQHIRTAVDHLEGARLLDACLAVYDLDSTVKELTAESDALAAEVERLKKVLANARAEDRKRVADLLHVAWKYGAPIICRNCGHLGGDHDAGECWAATDDSGTQCACTFSDLWPTELTTLAKNGATS